MARDMWKRSVPIVVSLCLSAAGLRAEGIRLNQIQVIGTHNSYHLAPSKEMLGLIGLYSKRGSEAWAYSRKPLDQQLEEGLRQFELDIFADPKGGLWGSSPEMKKPGMKVGCTVSLSTTGTCNTFMPGFFISGL